MALSLTKAKFVAFPMTVQEVVWLKHFLVHLDISDSAIEPMIVN